MGLSAVGFSSSLCRAFSLSNCSRVVEDLEEKHQSTTLSPPCSHKWRLAIAYDGTGFSGALTSHDCLRVLITHLLDRLLTLDLVVHDNNPITRYKYITRSLFLIIKCSPPKSLSTPFRAALEAPRFDHSIHLCWQYQDSPPTVQCLVEKALMQITKLDRKELCLVGASRTDSGVHAWGQVAHFVTPFIYDDGLESLHAAINGLLPNEIRVREISPAKPEFHARFSTISKIYHYKIYNNPIMDPFQYRYAYHCAYKLNPIAMREAAAYFVGKHDFTSFANAIRNDHMRDPVKDIIRFDIREMDSLLQLEVEGTGFLYRQVRNMVALLLQIGREALPPDIVPKIIAARDRRELAKVALSAPPHGLCLVSVKYDHDLLQPPANCPPVSFGRTHRINKCKLSFY